MGIRLESVSMGKGFIHWRIITPPLQRRPRGLAKDYEDLVAACLDLKKHFQRDEVDSETATLVDEKAPDPGWGTGS